MRSVSAITLLALSMAMHGAFAAEPKKVAKAKSTAQVVAPGGRVEGKTIAEWGEAWWQWLLAVPNVHDPALDQTGEKCQYGQSGPVWFLAGSYSDQKIARRCTIPTGKYVLFPVANTLVRPLPTNDADCSYALDGSARGLESVVAPYATIDGRTVPNMWDRRERTGSCFDAAQTGRKVSAADGYWVMLRPLPAGKYVLKFGNDESGPARKDVTLVLTVQRDVAVAHYDRWPDPAVFGGVQESPSFPGGVSWMGGGAIMPVTPLFDQHVVIRRAAALIARDGRYTPVRAKTRPMGSNLWLSVAPRDVAEFDSRSPEIARDFHSPVWIWTEAPKDGKVRFAASSLVLHGPGRAHGIQASRDIQRFLLQALDKNVAVSDHEMRAVFAAPWPTWEELTKHRPPVPERSAEQKAADRKFSQEVDARLARATEATRPAPGKVYLKAEYPGTARVSPDGLSVEQCCNMGSAVVKATRTHSYGKYYFEAELRMPSTRGAKATWTNLGIVYGNETAYGEHTEQVFEHAEETNYPGGMVVGIAADLDAQRLYVHINGAWRGGEPGSDGGRLLKAARAYTAYFAAGQPAGKEQQPDVWTVNFGASAFRYPLPAGYSPYDYQ